MRLAFQYLFFPFYFEYRGIPVTWMLVILLVYLCKNCSSCQAVINTQKSMQNWSNKISLLKYLFSSNQKILFYVERVNSLLATDFVFVDSLYCMKGLMHSHKLIGICMLFLFAICLFGLIWLAFIYLFMLKLSIMGLFLNFFWSCLIQVFFSFDHEQKYKTIFLWNPFK